MQATSFRSEDSWRLARDIVFFTGIITFFIPCIAQSTFGVQITDGTFQAFLENIKTCNGTSRDFVLNFGISSFFIGLSCSYIPGLAVDIYRALYLSSSTSLSIQSRSRYEYLIVERTCLLVPEALGYAALIYILLHPFKNADILYVCLFRLKVMCALYATMRVLELSQVGVYVPKSTSLLFIIGTVANFSTYGSYLVPVLFACLYVLAEFGLTYFYMQKVDVRKIFFGKDTEYWPEILSYTTSITSSIYVLSVIISTIVMKGDLLVDFNKQYFVVLNLCTSLYFFSMTTVYSNMSGTYLVIAKSVVMSLREFIRQLSHEIRTPLTVVQGSLEIIDGKKDIMKGSMGTEDYHEIALALEESFESMDVSVGILNESLVLDKIQSGTLTYDKQPTSLGDFLRTTSKIFYGKSVVKRVNFDYSICNEQHVIDLIVNIDALKMARVMRNFLSNALKFTKAGGNIRVVVETFYKDQAQDNWHYRILPLENDIERLHSMSHNFIRVSVKDSGVGIASGYLERLFHESLQVDARRNQGGGGSGYGLLIAKEIVEKHDGSVGVHSAGLSQGSTFYFELPLYSVRSDTDRCCRVSKNSNRCNEYEAEEAVNQNPDITTSSDAFPESTLSIQMGETSYVSHEESWALIVEDTNVCSKIILKMLNRFGIHAKVVEDGQQAVQEIIQNPLAYCMIVMDNKMPVMNGLDATEAIRKLNFDRPIIGITGNVMDDDIQLFMERGANEVLAKPIKVGDFKDLLVRYGIIVENDSSTNVHDSGYHGFAK